MNKIIYASSVSYNVLEKLNISNKVHSTFDKGINIEAKDALVFIGGERMRVPFGIHLSLEDLKKLDDVSTEDKYRFNSSRQELLIGKHIISFSQAELYSSVIPFNKDDLDINILKKALDIIMDLNFNTGFDLKVRELLLEDSSPVRDLRENLGLKDRKEIEKILRNIIGRGKGLTPSGDDLLLGILLSNRIGQILDPVFLEILGELINQELLTTMVSVNYYQAGLRGEFSSPMIDLYQGILKKDEVNIEGYIRNIINYGHTSGRDTLAGIAIGIEGLIKKLGGR